ncbi:hypothetical protein [Streptomyces montanus]|uniref:hypothetical protein n=1 Tax=Streptomyces montanus TaxID=2580423 RepID=UPI001BB1FA01|nr:hypothetical protein [Streptomyces montanus]
MERFLAAVRGGELQGLVEVLAPDVVVVSDGGGVVPVARRRSRARTGWALLSVFARAYGG